LALQASIASVEFLNDGWDVHEQNKHAAKTIVDDIFFALIKVNYNVTKLHLPRQKQIERKINVLY